MNNLLRTFPNDPLPPYIERGDGCTLTLKNGHKLTDFTGGITSHSIVGWSNPTVIQAINKQLNRITHIDYKTFGDENRDMLAELLLSRAEHKLNRVYFCGNSGGEACEAAMKLSFQYHLELGKKNKKCFISREQSYHGSSTDAIAVGDRSNLYMYDPILPPNRYKISEHNKYRHKLVGETDDEYALRSAHELEQKILDIGPENVCAFIAETIQGGLVGYVPPAINYWKYVREVCNKYDVHLILDEVICGTGTSGKIYCCDYDQVNPDFIFMGKTLASGYAPISVVLTDDRIEQAIANGQGRIQHSTTHQGHSLGVAAALAVQKIIHCDETLEHVNNIGSFIVNELKRELISHPFYGNIRGRGLRLAIEYTCQNQNALGHEISRIMLDKYKILIDGKWHRVSFSPILTIDKALVEEMLDRFISTFKQVADTWSSRKQICASVDPQKSII